LICGNLGKALAMPIVLPADQAVEFVALGQIPVPYTRETFSVQPLQIETLFKTSKSDERNTVIFKNDKCSFCARREYVLFDKVIERISQQYSGGISVNSPLSKVSGILFGVEKDDDTSHVGGANNMPYASYPLSILEEAIAIHVCPTQWKSRETIKEGRNFFFNYIIMNVAKKCNPFTSIDTYLYFKRVISSTTSFLFRNKDIYEDTEHYMELVKKQKEFFDALEKGHGIIKKYAAIGLNTQKKLLTRNPSYLCVFIRLANSYPVGNDWVVDHNNFSDLCEHVIFSDHFNESSQKPRNSYFVLHKNEKVGFLFNLMRCVFEKKVNFERMEIQDRTDIVVEFSLKNPLTSLEKMVVIDSFSWKTTDVIRLIVRKFNISLGGTSSAKSMHSIVSVYPVPSSSKGEVFSDENIQLGDVIKDLYPGHDTSTPRFFCF
jgi:hypothetical protein